MQNRLGLKGTMKTIIKQKIKLNIGALCFFVFLLVMVAYLAAFNNELVGKPISAYFDLINDGRSISKNEFLQKVENNFRVTAYHAEDVGARLEKPILHLTLKEGQKVILSQTLMPRFSEGAGTKRGSTSYSHLNYGLFEIPKNGNYNIRIETSSDLNGYDIFQARVSTHGSNGILHFLQIIATAFLFLSTYLRQKVFKGSFLKSVIAYLLFVALGIFPLALSFL